MNSPTDRVGSRPLAAAACTVLAMVAFAANSVICRVALKSAAIDPASFSSIRVLAGASVLALILLVRRAKGGGRSGNWPSGFLLFGYAACFSFAYVSLNAATGALILFSFVQATMIVLGLAAGDRPQPVEWVGWVVAASGLGYLLLPGIEAPSVLGAFLMGLAGVAWGIYSARGRGSTDPLGTTGGNFLRAIPFVLLVSVVMLRDAHVTVPGILWAVLSGAVTSGLGYVIWYAALPGLTSMQAALVQLTVPPLAAAGGAWALAEPLTRRLSVSGGLILGGVAVALVGKALLAARRTVRPVR